MKIAVVTGASSGMGREFARHIAKNEPIEQIWLIARRKDRLEELTKELPCPAKVIALDLTDKASFDVYQQLLVQEQPEIHLLLNASGYGKFGHSRNIALEDCCGMIELNCRALVAITQLSLPYLKKGSRIWQLDSLSSFQPVPYLNVYAASKAFVLSYSRGLRAELKKEGISVMAICPGWVKTEFFDRAQTPQRNDVPYKKPLFEAEQIVKRAVRDDKKHKAVSICGLSVRNQVRLVKFLPTSLVLRIWMRQQGHS